MQPHKVILISDCYAVADGKAMMILKMGDYAKRGDLPTWELFTMILCGPNFAIS